MMTMLSKYFVLFYIVIRYYFLNAFLPRKPQDLLRISVFSYVYFLSVGIPILKIDLSHTRKSVTSDVILLKLLLFFFSSHELSWRSRHIEWITISQKCIAA